MSSLLIIQQSNAVHIIMDGAAYDEAGVVQRIASKVVDLPVSNCALAIRGASWAKSAIVSLIGLAPSLDDACDMLPDVMSNLLRIYDGQNGDEQGWIQRNFEITIAGWSDRAQAWVACLASTYPANFAEDPTGWTECEGYEPGLPMFMSSLVAHPPIDIAAALGRDVSSQADVEALDVRRDGLALHCAQRLEPGVFLGEPQYLVGGFSELVTVSSAGIQRQILQEWPDAVGEMIVPEGAPSLQHWRDRIEQNLAA